MIDSDKALAKSIIAKLKAENEGLKRKIEKLQKDISRLSEMFDRRISSEGIEKERRTAAVAVALEEISKARKALDALNSAAKEIKTVGGLVSYHNPKTKRLVETEKARRSVK